MTERSHGIKVGSKVRVLSSQGSSQYKEFIGKVLTVEKVDSRNYGNESLGGSEYNLIWCEGVNGAQFPDRFELVPEPKVNLEGELLDQLVSITTFLSLLSNVAQAEEAFENAKNAMEDFLASEGK